MREAWFWEYLSARFYRIIPNNLTRRLVRSAGHYWHVPGTEGSEIISINAEISLRNRCFLCSHISVFPGNISANMTEKVLESGENAYWHPVTRFYCNILCYCSNWGPAACKYGRAAGKFHPFSYGSDQVECMLFYVPGMVDWLLLCIYVF